MTEIKIHQRSITIEETRLNPGQLTRQVLKEAAQEIGGDTLEHEVVARFSQEELLADHTALQHLEDIKPGTKEQVIEKIDQKQQEAVNHEFIETNKSFFRKFGSSVLNLIKQK